MDWVFLSELAINGALTGLLYSLFAIGLVLIYKASSVPNLAQGGLTMVGAYVVLALARDVGLPLWLAIPLAAVVMFGLGFGIERVALRRLAGRPVVMILMLTLGLDIFLRGTTLAIWGGTSRSMELGVSYDPLFLGDIFISRIHLVGAGVALAAETREPVRAAPEDGRRHGDGHCVADPDQRGGRRPFASPWHR